MPRTCTCWLEQLSELHRRRLAVSNVVEHGVELDVGRDTADHAQRTQRLRRTPEILAAALAGSVRRIPCLEHSDEGLAVLLEHL